MLAITESPEDVLRNRFAEMKLEMEAFSSLRYIGVQTTRETDFSDLKQAVKSELENTTVRSPRQPAIVFQTLKVGFFLSGLKFFFEKSNIYLIFFRY